MVLLVKGLDFILSTTVVDLVSKKVIVYFIDLLDESQTKLSSDLLEARRSLGHIEVHMISCILLMNHSFLQCTICGIECVYVSAMQHYTVALVYVSSYLRQ